MGKGEEGKGVKCENELLNTFQDFVKLHFVNLPVIFLSLFHMAVGLVLINLFLLFSFLALGIRETLAHMNHHQLQCLSVYISWNNRH